MEEKTSPDSFTEEAEGHEPTQDLWQIWAASLWDSCCPKEPSETMAQSRHPGSMLGMWVTPIVAGPGDGMGCADTCTWGGGTS